MKPSWHTRRPYGKTGQLHANVLGIVNHLQWAMEFVTWASSLRTAPSPAQIQQRFGVSRATSYRYKAAWDAVAGTMEARGETR
jgi:hypothetical protein